MQFIPVLTVVLNRRSISHLAWFVDSAGAVYDGARNSILIVRPVGDYAILAAISHEFAHLALEAAHISQTQPTSLVECAADVIAGFETAAIAPRVSSSGGLELSWFNVLPFVGQRLAASSGDWVARQLHPDADERISCLQRGVKIYEEQAARAPMAGHVLMESRGDSAIDALSLGRTPLVVAAIIAASSILPIPGQEESGGAAPGARYSFYDANAGTLSQLLRTLLVHFDSAGRLTGVVGNRMSAGETRFPATQLYELLPRVAPPWKCAAYAGEAGKGRAIGCYAIGDFIQASMISVVLADSVRAVSRGLGFAVRRVEIATTRGSGVSLEQWILEKGTNRGVASFLYEPFAGAGPPSAMYSTKVLWFSFSTLSATADP